MPPRLPYRAALVAVCLLLLLSAVPADGAVLTKRGASGQTYVWQSGSC